MYLTRLEAGAFTLQLIDYILAVVAVAAPYNLYPEDAEKQDAMRSRILKRLTLMGSSVEDLKKTLQGIFF